MTSLHYITFYIQASGAQCLKFYTHMYGADVNTLNVYMTAGGQSSTRGSPVWTQSFNQGNSWKMGAATINPTGSYQVFMY